jgi:hypothetical protein
MHCARPSHRHGDLVVDSQGRERDDYNRQCHALRAEALDQRLEIWEDAVVESDLQRHGELHIARAFVRERQKADHGAAGWPLAESCEQGFERQGVGAAGEE